MSLSKVLILVTVTLLISSPAQACSCIPPTIKGTYFSPSVKNYVRAVVTHKQHVGSQIKYTVWVQKNYKGCAPKNPVMVYTPTSSAACGVSLTIGVSYVLPIRHGATPQIFLCDYIRKYSALTPADLHFLNTRNVCCFNKCKCASGHPPVNCFRQPCSPPEKPPCPEAKKCVDNYCGGCFAEWLTSTGNYACL